jgi:DNA modification methylase
MPKTARAGILFRREALTAAISTYRRGDGNELTTPPATNPPMEIRDRIRELRRVRAKDLIPNPKNWRRHPRQQRSALRGLLDEIGYADALLARELPDGRLMMVDGHLRAEITPDIEVPVLVLDVTEEEADKLLLSLDPLAAMAESDSERIKALLATVRTNSPAVEELFKRTAGNRLWEVLHPDEVKEADVSPVRADELREKWCTAPGQLWQAGPHRIISGDSCDKAVVERLWAVNGPPLRMIWTDPPYGVNYGEKTNWVNRHGGGPGRRLIENDSLKPTELQKLFATALSLAGEHAIPGAVIYATVPSVFLKYFIQGLEDGGFSYRHCLIWLKQTFVMGRADYHYRHEPILYGWLENGPHYFVDDRTHDSVFEVNRPVVSDLHPTTKPVELIAKMLANSSRSGDLIFDPFAGSGSTIMAAHQLGRVGYGCEIDPGYLAVSLERLSILGLKPRLVG